MRPISLYRVTLHYPEVAAKASKIVLVEKKTVNVLLNLHEHEKCLS